MPGRIDKLLVLKVGHFVPINGKRIQHQRTLRLFIEPAMIGPADEGSCRNRDHFFRDWLFTRHLRRIERP